MEGKFLSIKVKFPSLTIKGHVSHTDFLPSHREQVHVRQSDQVKWFPTQVKCGLLKKVKCMSPFSVICLLTKLKCPSPFSHKSSASHWGHGSSVQAIAFSKSSVFVPRTSQVPLSHKVLCNVHVSHIQVKCLLTQVKCMSPPPPFRSSALLAGLVQCACLPFRSSAYLHRSSACPPPSFRSSALLAGLVQCACLPFRSSAYLHRSSACPPIQVKCLLTQVKWMPRHSSQVPFSCSQLPFSHKSKSSLKLWSKKFPLTQTKCHGFSWPNMCSSLVVLVEKKLVTYSRPVSKVWCSFHYLIFPFMWLNIC